MTPVGNGDFIGAGDRPSMQDTASAVSQHRTAAATVDKKPTAATDELYKKHETLRSTGLPMAPAAVRRASMGSVPLKAVPEKKSKDSFFKKLMRLFSVPQVPPRGMAVWEDPTAARNRAALFGEPPKRQQPRLRHQSMHVGSAASDISIKTRQMTARASMGTSSADSGSSTPSGKAASSGADMLGTLCDEWHKKNNTLSSGSHISGVMASPAAYRPRANEHAQLTY